MFQLVVEQLVKGRGVGMGVDEAAEARDGFGLGI